VADERELEVEGDRSVTVGLQNARRNPLPEGTAAVGVGLVIAGLTSYVFLAVAKRALGEEDYAPLALLWTIVFLLGPGFFLPVEQEISRALAERRSRGLGGGPLLKRAALLAGGLLGILLLSTALGADVLMEKSFDGEELLVVGLALALIGVSAGHVARGACSGQGRFRPYAIFLGADGIIRLVICIALATSGVDSPGPYGIAVGIAPILAVLLAVGRERGLVEEGPPAPWREVTGALAALLVGSVLSFTLVNGGPLAVDLVGTEEEQAQAGTFLNALLIGRIPLFLFQAVQAALLPRLSSLAGAGRFEEFRTGMRRLLIVTGLLGGLAALGSYVLGPFVVETMFGDEVDHRTLGLLGLSCAAYMVALAIGQAVIALSGHRLVAASWGVGVAVFILVTAFGGDDVFLRVELGLVAGSTFAVVAMAASLATRLTAGAHFEPGPVIEALHDLPMEP
jgi:O-antigen/teichoic acid export membrane protein